MRSTPLTFLLGLLALLLCGVVGWRLTSGNLNAFFGSPPAQAGDPLYPDFNIADARTITLSGNGIKNAKFIFDPKRGWMAESPWQDRMDPAFAMNILQFTKATRVAEVIPRGKIDDNQAGFVRDDTISITISGADDKTLCTYLLGRKTAWWGEDPTTHEEVPTVFIRALDKTRRNRKNYLYACNGDIRPIFNDGFRYLRDHHPFLFNPHQPQRIRIRTTGGELTLARETPNSPWRIIKPLDLPSDIDAMFRLIDGLAKMRAVKVSNRADVTLPAMGAASGSEQIALQLFGMTEEIILEILPPQTPDARTRLATVSDRPNAVFELPIKSENEMITLSGLPLKVNELRDQTLTNIYPGSVTGVLIQPTGRDDILLTRHPKQFLMGQGAAQEPANDLRLNDLFHAVTRAKVTGFVTDAATDFTPWGLDKPFLSLRFLAGDSQSIELIFGRDKAGGVFANRRGTTSVVRVDDEIMSRIATQRYQWRDSRLWSLSRTDLKAIELTSINRPLTYLTYDDRDEKFTATRNGKDASGDLDANRAKYLVSSLEELQVNRWLPQDDLAASTALLNPVMTIKLGVMEVDEAGEDKGVKIIELRIARASETGQNRFYYGRLSSDLNPFMLDLDTIVKLTTPLFSEEN